jgi:CIC family chloride channel protein
MEPPQQLSILYQKISKTVSRYVFKAKMREHSFVLIIAVIIGLLSGYGAVGIQKLIKYFQNLFWQGDYSLAFLIEVPWYWKLIVPLGGGIIVGLIIQFVAKEAKGHGVPEVMESITLRGGIIRPRVVIAKLFASSIYIASGGSVGREGPVIQIGSAIGSTVGQFLRVNTRRMRTFVACGAASGIAAAFNAPVAGALFAVEVILGDFAVPQFSAVVVSSVMATVISRYYLGNYPAFIVPHYQLESPFELVFYVILGFLAAGVALMFIKTLYKSEEIFDNLKWPEYAKTGLGGLGIGFIGLFFPEIFGVGYDTIDSALQSGLIWKMALALVFLKVFATSLSLGSGGSGGIFAPSLFLGAMLGSFYGSLISWLFPAMDISTGAYALVAMGGVVAAATHGPIAAILIIFEMSGDYKIILPLMITCIIATILAMRLKKESIYTLKLKIKGINLFEGREINVLKSLTVKDVYSKNVELISEHESYPKVIDKISLSPHSILYVVDDKQKLLGTITLNEIRRNIQDYETLKHLLIVKDIMEPKTPVVGLDTGLDEVMKHFGLLNLDELPVVSNDNGNKIIGCIWRTEVINVYNKQIFMRDMSGSVGSIMKNTETHKVVHVIDDYYLCEIDAPMNFKNKSIGELNVGAKYKVDILLIKKILESGSVNHTGIHPDANYRIEMGDKLLLFGRKDSINVISKM